MTQVTYTSHPLVTVEHRPGGPVVVHDRHGSKEEVRRGRTAAAGVGFAGIVVLGFMLARIWQSGDLTGAHIRNAALVAAVLLVGVGYWIVAGRGREEITADGNHLVIRPRPLGVYRGHSISRDEIAYLQVEEDTQGGRNGYLVQIVDRDGYAVLPAFHVLSGISTQAEATALASCITQLFNFDFTSGLQPVARHWMTHYEAVMGPLAPGEEPDPSWPVQLPFGGTIRVRRSPDSTIIAFQRTLPAIRVEFITKDGKLICRYLPVPRSQSHADK